MRRVLLLICFASCFGEPKPRFEVHIQVPGPLAADRLHVRAAERSGPDDKRPLQEVRGGWMSGEAGIEIEPDGFLFRGEASIGTHRDVSICAWYDANADQIEGPGDFTGCVSPDPWEVRDGAGCSPRTKNQTKLPLTAIR